MKSLSLSELQELLEKGGKKQKIKPVLIGSAQLANGRSFEIRKIHPDKPGCSVTDKDGNITYAGSEAKAWSSVRYMGKIIYKTERSVA